MTNSVITFQSKLINFLSGGRRKEKRKLAETPSMLDPTQLAAKKQPSEDMTSPAIVIVEEAAGHSLATDGNNLETGGHTRGNIPENASGDASRAEQVTPTPKARTTPKNMRKKQKGVPAGKYSSIFSQMIV